MTNAVLLRAIGGLYPCGGLGCCVIGHALGQAAGPSVGWLAHAAVRARSLMARKQSTQPRVDPLRYFLMQLAHIAVWLQGSVRILAEAVRQMTQVPGSLACA